MIDNNYILGIDFGTTFSCVGVWKDDSVMIIPNSINERTTPSVVIFDNNGQIYVGEETKNKVWNEDSIKIYEIKRLIGKKYKEVENILDYFSYKVVKGDDDEISINMEFKNKKIIKKSPVEIAFLIINKLIKNAEIFLNDDKKVIKEIIITVPADFSDRQRDAIKSAAEMVKGIKVKKVINEPSAAVLSYGFPKKYIGKNKNIINKDTIANDNDKIMHPLEEIFLNENSENKELLKDNNNLIKENELINNSFKTSKESLNILVFDLGGGTYDVSLIEYSQSNFENLASAGNSRLGGGDLDNLLMEFCLNDFCNKNKDKNFTKEEIKKNIKCNQRLKIACEQAKIYLSYKTKDTIFIENFYKDESINIEITRSKFEEITKDFFSKLEEPINRVLSDSKLKKEQINEIVLVGGSSKIPKIKQILNEKFPNAIINDTINPDEAVAYGAAIFCESERRKTGDFWEDFDYIDSIQHSYGIEIDDGKMEFILKRGSSYPTSNTRYFFTYSDYQKNFIIKIYEGENDYVKDNEFLDEFILEGIPRKKKGEVCIEITFALDENQILNVTGFVADKNIKKKYEVKRKRKKYKISTLISESVSSEENQKEKQIKDEIIKYSNKFMSSKDNNEKMLLINKYNEAILFLLKILETKDLEIYFNFIEKLFQSYSYIFNSDFLGLMTKEKKEEMDEKIKYYLNNVVEKNPFKLKILLNYFKKINSQKAIFIFSISTIEYLVQLIEKKYLPFDKKNNAYIAKNIYEECISIAVENLYLKDKEKMKEIFLREEVTIELEVKFADLIKKCKEQILLISIKFSQGIDYTKQSGRLFDNNLDLENLSLISSNLFENLKDLDNNKNLIEQNKEIQELGSIGYANFVKIELLKNKNKSDLEKLLEYANKSIKMSEESGKDQTNKKWYKELLHLKEEIEKKLETVPKKIEPKKDLENFKEKMKNLFINGNKELVEYLLINYPIEKFQYSEEKMKEFQKNENKFLKSLNSSYKKATKFLKEFNEEGININENFDEIIQIIKEYINNMINRLKINN